MTLHTRPIQTQSIPLLQQGNLGNTQGILTAVTQWPLIRRHHHFLMSSKLSEHIFLGSKYFLSEERQIFPARGSGSLGLVSSYPSPRLRHLGSGSGSGDVTRHGVFSWEMCLSEQWIRLFPASTPSIQWKYLQLYWNWMENMTAAQNDDALKAFQISILTSSSLNTLTHWKAAGRWLKEWWNWIKSIIFFLPGTCTQTVPNSRWLNDLKLIRIILLDKFLKLTNHWQEGVGEMKTV